MWAQRIDTMGSSFNVRKRTDRCVRTDGRQSGKGEAKSMKENEGHTPPVINKQATGPAQGTQS